MSRAAPRLNDETAKLANGKLSRAAALSKWVCTSGTLGDDHDSHATIIGELVVDMTGIRESELNFRRCGRSTKPNDRVFRSPKVTPRITSVFAQRSACEGSQMTVGDARTSECGMAVSVPTFLRRTARRVKRSRPRSTTSTMMRSHSYPGKGRFRTFPNRAASSASCFLWWPLGQSCSSGRLAARRARATDASLTKSELSFWPWFSF